MNNQINKSILLLTFMAIVSLGFQASSKAQSRGFIGIRAILVDLPNQGSVTRNLPLNRGFKIQQVIQHSPAWKAGLRPGDILVQADEMLLNQYGSLSMAASRFGQRGLLNLSYVRCGVLGNVMLTSNFYAPNNSPNR